MGKLSLPPSRISSPPRRVGWVPDKSQGPAPVRSSAPWRAWYKTARWRALRLRILARDLYTCQAAGCGRVAEEGMVVDHRRPHRGDERLFWAEGNLQVLCKSPCHDKHKQRLEAESRHHVGIWD